MERSAILFVDDEALIRAFVGEVLREAGYDVIVSESAAQALTILAEDRSLDLLITDIRMPGRQNGFDLAHEAKLIRPPLRVLYISGYSWAAARAHAAPLHGELLQKPFKPNQLLAAVRRGMTSAP
jgi:DNA-binding NtrC family response regulator